MSAPPALGCTHCPSPLTPSLIRSLKPFKLLMVYELLLSLRRKVDKILLQYLLKSNLSETKERLENKY